MPNDSELNDFTDNRGESYLVPRWTTYWYQFSEIAKLKNVESILELGPGRGILGALCRHFGYNHIAIDIVQNKNARIIGDVTKLELGAKYDLTCAFQVLEHNEFNHAKDIIKALCELSTKYVYVSLPVSKRWVGLNIDVNLPRFRRYYLMGFDIGRLFLRKRDVTQYDRCQSHKYHWWELYEEGTSKENIDQEFRKYGFRLMKIVRVKTYRYHVGLIYEKT